MEDFSVTLKALLLLVVSLVVVLGLVIFNPVALVMLEVALVAIMGVILVRLTLTPAG